VGTRRGDIYVGEIAGLTVRTVKTLKAHNKRISSISVSPERQLASSAVNENAVRLWSLENFEQIGTLDHSGPVNAVAFSPRGSLLATATEDGKIVFWDRNVLKSIETIQQDSPVKHVAFDPSGNRLATVSKDSEIQLWSVQYETRDA
jgi:WD40 repeat protein